MRFVSLVLTIAVVALMIGCADYGEEPTSVSETDQEESTPALEDEQATEAQPEPVKTEAAHQEVRQAEAAGQEITVYITKTGKKYHKSGCRYLRTSKIAISKKNAIATG